METSFEDFIQELWASFQCSPVDETAAKIDDWIRRIAVDLDLDFCALAQIDAKTGSLTVRHSWACDHLIKLPIGVEFPRPAPWFDGMLMKGRPIIFSKVRELSTEFLDNDWVTFGHCVPKSSITVPIKINSEVAGALGFASLKRERTWSPRLIRRLELVAEIFANALQRRLVAEENALLHDELSHLSRSAVMGELTASLTHQLNQPIAAILMNAEEMQRMLESAEPDLENLRAAVADIIQDDLRATDTIKGLRSFFRKSATEKKDFFYIGEVLAEVMLIVRSDALFRNVSLTFEALVTQRQRIAGDRIQLQQAILNLVLNAFDAVSEQEDLREVLITMSADKDEVRVAVRDSGSGVDPVVGAKIFEPFFSTKPDGMGMGLAIARSIIKAHGGQISARRNSERGSTFEITLPALQEKI